MTKLNQILIGVFSAQLLLTAGIFYSSESTSGSEAQQPLLATEEQIDRITISNQNGTETVLKKVDNQWQLTNYHQLPAVQHKVNSVIKNLTDTHTGWPVATTGSGRERFEVADENYQKKITLSHGDETVQTLYLGTSPGFRQLHVRRADEENVYAVKLNSVDFPVKQTQWFDKTLLQPEGEIAALAGPDYELNKQGDEWTSDQGEIVIEEVKKITDTLARLNVHEVVDKMPAEEFTTLTVEAGGNTHRYRFFSKDNTYFVKRDDLDLAFKIGKSDFDKLTYPTAMQLVKQEMSEKEQDTVENNSESGAENHS